jgi:hypothetical protein
MKLAAYWLKYRQKTSRDTTPPDITVANVRDIRGLRDWELNHTDMEAPEGIINAKDWPKTVEGLNEFLRGNLGVTGIPLAYVIRDEMGVTNDPADGWPTKQDEMIGRAPIENAAGVRVATFVTDNQRVWELLAAITRDHDCWTYVKVAQRRRDGRAAYKSLYNHYLGPNAVDNMATNAERKLTHTTYDGEKKRWNFEKYTSTHVNAHHTLAGLVRHGYAGIDERTKVRYLIDGIRTNTLDAVKTRIMSDTELRSDFNQCVTLYKDMIQQLQAQEKRSFNVSAMKQEIDRVENGNKKKEDKKNLIQAKDVQDRYYEPKEYSKMTDEAKLKLKRLRDARGHQPKAKKAKLSNRQIKAIAAAVNDQQQSNGNDGDNSSSDDDTEQTGNRANRNLTRQNGRNNRR